MMKRVRHISLFLSLSALMFVGGRIFASDFHRDGDSEMTDVVKSAPTLKVLNRAIEVVVTDDDVHNVAVYALTGQVVKTVEATEGATRIDLNAGYYIVKIDDDAHRVIVR